MDWKLLWNGKKGKLILAVGLLGILLIFLSTFFPDRETSKSTETPTEPTMSVPSTEEYRQEYETALLELVKSIRGAGNAQVFVTLETGVQYVYETEENKTADTQNESPQSHSTKSTLEKTILLVEGENGRKQPVLRTTLEPEVRGVVVVCEGGGDVRIVERVTSAVTAMLGVSTTKVAVLPSK